MAWQTDRQVFLWRQIIYILLDLFFIRLIILAMINNRVMVVMTILSVCSASSFSADDPPKA